MPVVTIQHSPLSRYTSKGARDSIVCKNHEQLVWSHASTDIGKARLLAAASPHSGDSLAAPPITSVGLRLTDEQLGISCSQTGLQSGRTTHMRLWKSDGCT